MYTYMYIYTYTCIHICIYKEWLLQLGQTPEEDLLTEAPPKTNEHK